MSVHGVIGSWPLAQIDRRHHRGHGIKYLLLFNESQDNSEGEMTVLPYWTIPIPASRTTTAASPNQKYVHLKPVLYFPRGQSERVHRRRLLVFILLEMYAGGPLHRRAPYMRSRSAWTVNKHVNRQLPGVTAHLAVFILFYRRIVQVRVSTGFFTQPAHAQLVLL